MNALDLKRVGASDVPAILGIDSYVSPRMLYNRIVHAIDPDTPAWVAEAAELGKQVEPIVVRRVLQDLPGYTPIVPESQFLDDWGRVTVDFELRKPDRPVIITETKSRNEHSFRAQEWTDTTPAASVVAQVGMQWAAYDALGFDVDPVARVGVIINGQRIRTYALDFRGPLGETADAILARARGWYDQHIRKGVVPEITHLDVPKRKAPRPVGRVATGPEEAWMRELQEVRARQKKDKRREETLKNQLTEAMDEWGWLDAPGLRVGQRNKRGRIDHKKVSDECVPLLYGAKDEREAYLESKRGDSYREIYVKET